MSLKTARLAVTLGSLCRDRFGVHYHPSLDALRAVCRVARVHVPPCNAILFSRKKTGRRSKLLASNVGCFLLMYVYLVENSTACRNSGFPVQGQVLGYIIIQVWTRCVPCAVWHACMCPRVMRSFFLEKKQAAGPNCLRQMSGVFCSCTYISLKTARLAVTLGSLCRDRFEYIIIQVWAHCVQCTVSHARLCRVECDTFFLIQRTGRRSKLLGCNFELEDASSSPGKHFFFCFFLVRLFFAFHLLPFPPLPRLFFKCWCFSLKYYMIPVRVSYHVIGTARLSPQLTRAFPVQGQV